MSRRSVDRDLTRIMQNFDRWTKDVTDGTVDIVQEAGSKVLAESKKLVGRETGALAASGRVTVSAKQSPKRGTRISATISYGGKTPIKGKNSPDGIVRYAAIHHAKNPYLLNAIQALQDELKGTVRQRYKLLARRRGRGVPGTGGGDE